MNLTTKIILSILCVLILFMGGFTYLIVRWQQAQFAKSTHHYSVILGEAISGSIATEMELGRSDKVQGTLERIGQSSEQIRFLRIFDRKGRILRSANPSEAGGRIDSILLESHLKHLLEPFEHQVDGKLFVSYIKPFPNRPPCQKCHDPKEEIIGFLDLDISLGHMQELVSSSKKFLLGSMGITLMFVLGSILWMTSSWIRIPLSKVISAMRRLGEGDFEVKVQLTSKDELGRVARIFNSMVETLKKNREDLEILHQRELERTQRMATLGELAEAIAHEIRNPLAGVSASLKIIREGLAKDDPQTKIFDEIHFQTDRIEKVVSNLLQLARKSTPQFSFFHTHRIIEKALHLFSFQFEDRWIRIERELQSNLPQIYADPDQIQHVVMNLILNAIQSMPEGGKLRFKTFRGADDGMVHLIIADTGKGISDEIFPKIFKPFYSTKAKGAGLGLAIVEKIVHEHGGKVAISSKVGIGTTVEISLPIKHPS